MTEKYDLKQMLENIIQEDEEITVSLKNLIWTILVYEHELHQKEQQFYDALDGRIRADLYHLKFDKEVCAVKSNVIAGIIQRYSDFDTSKIWEQTRKIHKLTNTHGR